MLDKDQLNQFISLPPCLSVSLSLFVPLPSSLPALRLNAAHIERTVIQKPEDLRKERKGGGRSHATEVFRSEATAQCR